MQDVTTDSLPFPSAGSASSADASTGAPLPLMEPRDALSQVLFDGATQMLIAAIEIEAATWIKQREHLLDDQGHRQVVRNGHAAPRTLVTPMGPMAVTMPRVHDRRPPGDKERFTSALLPPYLRKTKAMDELLPWLYLKGVSTPGGGDFTEALRSFLGPDCPGLSAATITRLRHDKTKGNGTRKACLAMVFKLATAAQKRWRKLKGHTLLTDVITGVRFIDGEKHKAA